MKKTIQFLIFTFLLTILNSVFADETTKILRFGVLSYRPKEITEKQWQPLAIELERVLPKYHVELLVMNYDELDKAARKNQLDFVFTNPEHYILLKNKIAMNAVATVITIDQGHPLTEFAGVIFTRANRDDIQTIADLNGKKIASVAEHSLGGYLMQRWELEKKNVHVGSYDFTGMPHDKVVDEVLAGKADAGFVRTGVLESLAKSGKIKLGDQATIKVVAPHNPNTVANSDRIYSLHSTDHYPEWSFNIGKHISRDIIHEVTLALLNIKPDSEIAKSANIVGFNSPADYTPVEILMLRLRSHPDELKYFNFEDVIWRYREFAVISFVVGLFIVILLGFLIRANRRFKNLMNENEKLLLAVEQSASSIFITDLQGEIEYVNHAFTKMTGYESAETIGKNPRLLKSGKTRLTTYHEMWQSLLNGQRWKGEFVNLRKDCSEYIVSSSITPVRKSNGTISHYVAVEEDITERKKNEEIIRQLAFYDSLTGLPNRRKLLDRLNYAITLSHRERKQFSVFMMDLDKFKAVNDSLGHAAGDDLLKQVADRIKKQLRDSDMVARLGGDEFVILLENLNHIDDAAQVALKVIEDLTKPFTLSCGETVQIGASIGISFYPSHGHTPEILLDHADTALYQAKDNGRGCFVYYS
jgi:diguanylate cyclase (GGDEF)-like protein/PAS domain S-box-containing protein